MIYNVLAGVVALIDAQDEDAAKDELRRRLQAAGFDVYEGQPLDAFASDDQTPEPTYERRVCDLLAGAR